MKFLALILLFCLSPQIQAQGNVERTRSFLSHILTLGQSPSVGECKRPRQEDRLYSSPAHFRDVELHCPTNRTARFEGETLSVITLEQAQNLFQQLEAIDYLPMKYLEDGCYARAHEITLIAEQNNLQMGKAFLNAPEGGELLYPENLRGQSPPRFDPNFSGWRYHATPFLIVEHPDGSLRPMVFDLGVARGPQTFEEWRRNLHRRPAQTQIVTRHRDYVFDSGSFRSPGVSIIDRLQETQSLIDELGWSEYMFRLDQGWL